MTSKDLETQRREQKGWLTLLFMMILFPVLFFLCVWIPIWMDIASPF